MTDVRRTTYLEVLEIVHDLEELDIESVEQYSVDLVGLAGLLSEHAFLLPEEEEEKLEEAADSLKFAADSLSEAYDNIGRAITDARQGAKLLL